jgi:phospholipase C
MMGEGPVTVRVRHKKTRYYAAIGAAVVLGAGVAAGTTVTGASAAPNTAGAVAVPQTSPASSWTLTSPTSTPIKHVVVLFDENESFDHYFGTYPYATNKDGTSFTARRGTPAVNGLYNKITSKGPTGPLLTNNPNLYNPHRLTHSEALTCDQNHGYTPEQNAVDNGKMDNFVQDTETDTCTGQPILFGEPGLVMDYYDGNTVSALWNYAQNYAMSDNNWDTNFGPSTPGALNLISGSDGDGYSVDPASGAKVPDPGSVSDLNSAGLGTIYGDLDPAYDDCSDASHTSTSPLGVMTGKNIGDLLNAKGVSWGWFQGGFAPSATNSAGLPVCGASHSNIGGNAVADYSPHHNPFEYYKSTANPKHLPPSSESAIGHTDQANHEYDLSDFSTTLKDGNLPSVSFLKAAEYQDAHPGYSDPLDEQNFLVNTINQIEQSTFWSSTAIVITYDDSDGWYDHQAPKIVNGSSTAQDAAICTAAKVRLGDTPDRCGYSQRLPMLVISPWTRANHVSHNLTDTASVTKFIENNWLGGKRIGNGSFDASSGSLNGLFQFFAPNLRPVILNPTTGAVVKQ